MFSNFTATLDSEMKRLRSLGFGSKKRQAEPFTEEEEELLWSTGQLGDHNPQALVDTMLYMNGIYLHYEVAKSIETFVSNLHK